MLLAVDVGNTNTSFGVFEDPARPDLRCEVRISTRHTWTGDEVAMVLDRGLGLHGIELRAFASAIVACVVPPALAPLCQAIERFCGVRPLVVGPGTRTGMPIRYEPAQDVGADRIVTAIAAHARYGAREGRSCGVIVVDFGTATTFDVVGPRPEYLGGAIAPGIGIGADALFSRAAKLPRVDIVRPRDVVGRDTVSSIQSGLVFGYVGLVEGLIRRIRTTLDFETTVVATGGFARSLAAETDCVDAVDDTLVLEGLRLLHLKNR